MNMNNDGVSARSRSQLPCEASLPHLIDTMVWVYWGTFSAALLVFLAIWLNVPGTLWLVYRQRKAARGIPGWPTHWLYGNLHNFRLDQATLLRRRNSIRENDWRISRTWVGPFRVIINIHHPDELRKVIKEPKSSVAYNVLKPWLGEGLLIAEGERWHRSRRLLTPAFHYAILKPYVSVYGSCIQSLVEKWTASATKKKSVKLFDTVCLLSLDIILQCAFSYKSDCQSPDGVTHKDYAKAVVSLSYAASERSMNPLYQIDWIYWLTPHGRQMKQLCKLVHDHAEKIIEQRKKALGLDASRKITDTSAFLEQVSESRRLDFLDILLTAVDEDGVGLSDLEIRNEVDTFMFEGHDTTTSGMCWTLYCLAQHPEHQQNVREEVGSVLAGRQNLTYDDLKELKYTQCCIKEAMRLYPPVNGFVRELSKDTELDGHLIPKGTSIIVPIRTIHYNPKVWSNPDEFDPTRFFPSNAEGRDPYAYLPFSIGSRNCIGQNFALNEEKTVVASIVHHFRLTVNQSHKVEFVPRLVLRAVDDIKIKLEQL